MRLFIAIKMNDEMTDALVSLQDAMRRRGVSGNYVAPDNLHLTLAFIGEYADPYTVSEVIEQIVFEPFSIKLSGIGSFEKLWWAGISENEDLKKIVKRLRYALADAGIPFDRKKFSPHITLIRKPVCAGGTLLEGILDDIPEAEMTVGHISLMRSDRGKHGMVYTEL